MQRLPNIQIGWLTTLLTLAAFNTLAAAQPATTPSDPQHTVVSTGSHTLAAPQDAAAAERTHGELGMTHQQALAQDRPADPVFADASQETSRWCQDLALLAMSPLRIPIMVLQRDGLPVRSTLICQSSFSPPRWSARVGARLS